MALVYQDISLDGARNSMSARQIRALYLFGLPLNHIFCMKRTSDMNDGNTIPEKKGMLLLQEQVFAYIPEKRGTLS